MKIDLVNQGRQLNSMYNNFPALSGRKFFVKLES